MRLRIDSAVGDFIGKQIGEPIGETVIFGEATTPEATALGTGMVIGDATKGFQLGLQRGIPYTEQDAQAPLLDLKDNIQRCRMREYLGL